MKMLLALITVICRLFGLVVCLLWIFPLMFIAMLPVFVFSILMNLVMPFVKAVSPKYDSDIRNIASSEIKCLAEDAIKWIINLL